MMQLKFDTLKHFFKMLFFKKHQSKPFYMDLIVLDIGEKCPYCKKTFTFDDIKKGNISTNEVHVHTLCWANNLQTENQKYFEDILSEVYGKDSFKLSTIPNKYGCGCFKCQNTPWFDVMTPNGKIKIGNRGQVESITFYEDVTKSINLFDVFLGENTTKYCEGNEFIIHAWSKEDTIKYLRSVKEAMENQ